MKILHLALLMIARSDLIQKLRWMTKNRNITHRIVMIEFKILIKNPIKVARILFSAALNVIKMDN